MNKVFFYSIVERDDYTMFSKKQQTCVIDHLRFDIPPKLHFMLMKSHIFVYPFKKMFYNLNVVENTRRNFACQSLSSFNNLKKRKIIMQALAG